MAINIQQISQEIKNKCLEKAPKCSFRVGDILEVNRKLDNRRHNFQGICIAKKENGASSTFTLLNHDATEMDRVEITLYTYNPDLIYKVVSTIKKYKRGQLYYLREKYGKQARIPQNYDKTLKKS
jgi:large subunit ribosomal protein L19